MTLNNYSKFSKCLVWFSGPVLPSRAIVDPSHRSPGRKKGPQRGKFTVSGCPEAVSFRRAGCPFQNSQGFSQKLGLFYSHSPGWPCLQQLLDWLHWTPCGHMVSPSQGPDWPQTFQSRWQSWECCQSQCSSTSARTSPLHLLLAAIYWWHILCWREKEAKGERAHTNRSTLNPMQNPLPWVASSLMIPSHYLSWVQTSLICYMRQAGMLRSPEMFKSSGSRRGLHLLPKLSPVHPRFPHTSFSSSNQKSSPMASDSFPWHSSRGLSTPSPGSKLEPEPPGRHEFGVLLFTAVSPVIRAWLAHRSCSINKWIVE